MSLPEMDTNTIRGLLLLCMLIGFLGIWVWAWSSKRKTAFKDASQLPLEDDKIEPEDERVKE
jgi:cytochrome c oxidase cbb3-type subunit 4